MIESERPLTVFIGEDDIELWATTIGKDIVMPELLISCEHVIYDKIEAEVCMQVGGTIQSEFYSYDFIVQKIGVYDTLSKILQWAVEIEDYEICRRVTDLKEYYDAETIT